MRHPGRGDGQDRITIRDVAAAAGVSTATVSRALSRSEAVTRDLAERVRAAAAALRYVPNASARALASLHSGQVGVVVDGVARHAETVSGLLRRLAGAGLAALVLEVGGVGEEATAQFLVDHDLEGVVTVGARAGQAVRALLADRPMPWVEVGGSGIAIELRSAAAALADHLTTLGHARVGYVFTGAGEDAGWLALARSRLPGPGANVSLADLGAGPGMPTALLCSDDLVALEVVQRCHRRGIAVPDALSVIGYGDRPFAAAAVPALTTIRIPAAALGEAAVDHLLALRAGRPIPPPSVPAKLVIRRSSGPACQ